MFSFILFLKRFVFSISDMLLITYLETFLYNFRFSTEPHVIILLSNSGCGGALPQVVMEEGGTGHTVTKYGTHRAFVRVYKRDDGFNPNTKNEEAMGYVFKLF